MASIMAMSAEGVRGIVRSGERRRAGSQHCRADLVLVGSDLSKKLSARAEVDHVALVGCGQSRVVEEANVGASVRDAKSTTAKTMTVPNRGTHFI